MEYEFGMFTDTGEEVVSQVVKLACTYALSDTTINQMLVALSNDEAFAEASDTVVRERVFKYLNRAAW